MSKSKPRFNKNKVFFISKNHPGLLDWMALLKKRLAFKVVNGKLVVDE